MAGRHRPHPAVFSIPPITLRGIHGRAPGARDQIPGARCFGRLQLTVRVEADELLGGDDPTCKHRLHLVDRIGGDWPSFDAFEDGHYLRGRALNQRALGVVVSLELSIDQEERLLFKGAQPMRAYLPQMKIFQSSFCSTPAEPSTFVWHA